MNFFSSKVGGGCICFYIHLDNILIIVEFQEEYDNYLSYLLDGQQGKHLELEEQTALLSEWHKTKTPELKADMCQKLELEMEVHKKLQENER